MTEINPTGWRIDYQNQRTKVNAAGQIDEGYEVTFTTIPGGHVGTVFVSENRYNPDNVRAAVAEKAAMLDHVGQLTHES